MNTATAAEPLHLVKLEIENYLRVAALEIDADGRHVLITGRNGAGKTTAVNAIWAALQGLSSKATPEPIHQGADRAVLRLDLGEYRVERVIKEKSATLVVTAPDGSKFRRPQELLDGLLGQYSLDPVAFLGRRPQDQLDDVLSVCGVRPPVDQVAEIAGERHEARPGESADTYLARLSADETGLYYLRRREAGRAFDQKRKALDEQRERLKSLGGAPDAQPVSASELLGRIEQLQQKAEARRAVEERADASARDVDDVRRRLAEREEQLGTATRRVVDLRKQLEEAEAAKADLEGRIARGREMLAEAEAQAQADAEAAEKLPDPAPRIADLRRQVAMIEQINAVVARRQHAAAEADRLAEEAERAAAEHGRQETILARLRDLRRHQLDGLKLGVAGLTADDGGLRLNGVPFRQASQAEQIRVAAAVAMMQRPRLRLLRVDDGEHLDRNSRELLLRLAGEQGWQVIMTAVADDQELRVEVVEGVGRAGTA